MMPQSPLSFILFYSSTLLSFLISIFIFCELYKMLYTRPILSNLLSLKHLICEPYEMLYTRPILSNILSLKHLNFHYHFFSKKKSNDQSKLET